MARDKNTGLAPLCAQTVVFCANTLIAPRSTTFEWAACPWLRPGPALTSARPSSARTVYGPACELCRHRFVISILFRNLHLCTQCAAFGYSWLVASEDPGVFLRAVTAPLIERVRASRCLASRSSRDVAANASVMLPAAGAARAVSAADSKSGSLGRLVRVGLFERTGARGRPGRAVAPTVARRRAGCSARAPAQGASSRLSRPSTRRRPSENVRPSRYLRTDIESG
jgi:hypothetical protein